MSYDALSRKTPVQMHICNYGVHLERIQFGVLTPAGVKDADAVPMRMLYEDAGKRMITDAIKHEELGEFYLIIETTDMDDAGAVESDTDSLFVVDIKAVSPTACAGSCLESAARSSGCEKDEEFLKNPIWQAECLSTYGKAAHLWQAAGDDEEQLIEEAKKRLPKIISMFGFYVDQSQNRMGESGWDWIMSPEKRTALKEG